MPKLRELDQDEQIVNAFLVVCAKNCAPLGLESLDPKNAAIAESEGFDANEYAILSAWKRQTGNGKVQGVVRDHGFERTVKVLSK